MIISRPCLCLALLIASVAAYSRSPSNANGATFVERAPQREEVGTNLRHWRKYINRQYGFSFWYPDTYRPRALPPPDSWDKVRPYQKRLLLLERRDDPDANLWIGIDLRPFNLSTMSHSHSKGGMDPDWTPVGHPIGRHTFYFFGPGGGGVNYTDDYFVELKGKTLGFYFGGPYVNSNQPSRETQLLEPKILNTFRTF